LKLPSSKSRITSNLRRRLLPRLGIVTRLTLMGVLTMSVAVAASIAAAVKTTEAEMYRRAEYNLDVNIRLLDSILSDYGAPSRQGDKLYFGTTLINGNFAAVDRIRAAAGGTATIFLDDLRVSTNVMKPDGTRAVGTRLAAGPARDAVFGRHQTYRGEADILGENYLTIYEPIVSDGTVIGIAYVGVKTAEFFGVLRSLLMTNLYWSVGVIVLAGLAMFLLIGRIFAPVAAIKRELIEIAGAASQRELDARTLAALDVHLDELRETLYGRGEPRRSGNLLYFGNRPVNDDLALVDGIAARDSVLITVFMGDRRVTTNVGRADGSRLIGTTLEHGPVYDRVLREGKTHRGEANIFGVPHFAIYEPIQANGEVIGILFVGMPRRAVTERDGPPSIARSSDEIAEMRRAASELGKAVNAKEIAEQDAAELRQRAEEQRHRRSAEEARAAKARARAVKERARAMEEISSTVKRNAADAAKADQVATQTCAVADQGGQVVARAVAAMSRIEESSHKIADIIAVIDEIARQTNLLALNAAVEAARAGDAGRGFAVVATEVRELAQRSSQAAKDIKALIGSSADQVHDGVALVNSAGKALGEIVDSIKKVAVIVSGIAVANGEQAAGLEQINKALTQLDDAVQQPADGPTAAIADIAA
jgi:methyl-accepting chemotaxis protein